MKGLWGDHSQQYLYVLSVGTLLLFGLPILIRPLGWARLFRWPIPEQTDLANYFGRCLAGLICVLAFFAYRAGTEPQLQPFFFDLLLSSFAVMVAIHLYGAIKKIQPLSETIEIAYWLFLFFLTLCFYPK